MEDIELIEAYLTGRLNDDQKREVELRCERDTTFAMQLKEERLIYEVVSDKPSQTFLRTVNQVLAKEKKIVSKRLEWSRKVLFFAASLLLLVCLIYFIRPAEKPDLETVYSEFFQPYPMVLSQRGPESQSWTKMVKFYEERQWEMVEQEIVKLSPDVLPTPLQDLYWAISMMEQDKASDAINLLKNYQNNPTDQLYQSTIEWYLSLAYLKSEDSSGAKSILKDLREKVDSKKLRENIDQLLSVL